MATIQRFEDLEVWKLARELAFDIYTTTLKGTFAKDNDLKWQIRKSSGSVMDNIAEGFERDGKNEMIQFLSISKGSVGELRSQVYRALDRKHINECDFDLMMSKLIQLSKKISAFIKYLKINEFKGIKYKRGNET
ncbi:MAG: four helix bundle protein [Bacteroidetes bacterium]|nr:four helix bundle protein [Bacteroidota bacterium]